ncbi:hybrid sensor histidine kinase/response regulator [Roseateles sp. DC23W]|uniref:histidine kinase n=1 Tax=Pelomonas dachongensis TaxID=3299029 RepID=A0ABW7EYF6_9BURK
MAVTRLLLLGPKGTAWLFGLIVLAALGAWSTEMALGIIEPSDRFAYPLLAAAFSGLAVLCRRRPQAVSTWQRCGAVLLGLYFSGSMLAFTLRPDHGPSLYTLGSIAPWTLGGCLLLFTTWPAGRALRLSLALMLLMIAPPTLLRFSGEAPPWLLQAWPLVANLALCQVLFSLALWGLSRQLAPLSQLAPPAGAPTTSSELVKARLAELERSRAAAEAASRAKSDFLATIGHEIRTPMSTVLGQTRMLLGERLPPEQRDRLLDVARAGESLVRLIDGLLDYADLDAGRMPLAAEPLRIEPILASAFDAIRAAAQAKQLELQCDIAPELLGSAGSRRGDAARLIQLLSELLVNAVKFTPAGQVRLSVGLDGIGAWRLRVRDSGVGMAPEQLERLFLPFAQAEAGATRRFGGTGLGLAICRALAERMGGTLTAQSRPGRGSEFELVLPLRPCPELSPPAEARIASIVLVQAAHSSGHEALLKLLQALAPAARLQLLPQGSQALEQLGSAAGPRHDLLIVDGVLPDMEGSLLLERLSARGVLGATRIVLLSAFDTPLLRERALRHGAHALCAKPLLPHTLHRLLDLERPLAAAPQAPAFEDTPGPGTDPATLLSELDHLLAESDAHALTLWERHASAFVELLPATRAGALAGALQRYDFDEAQAALRGEDHKR